MIKHLFRAKARDAAGLLASARKAQADQRYQNAASLYDESLRLEPGSARVHLQAGHMFKESGQFLDAERHYLKAASLAPDDAEIALQIGFFYKVAGRFDQAVQGYRRALALRPDWSVPADELRFLEGKGVIAAARDLDGELAAITNRLAEANPVERLAPALVPLPPQALLQRNGESIHLRALGSRERTRVGERPVLRGVSAARGFCIAADALVEVQIELNGLPAHRGPVECHPLVNEGYDPTLRKYVFNVWLDVSQFTPGTYDLTIRFIDAQGTPDGPAGRRWITERVVVAAPLDPTLFAASDGLVAPGDPTDLRPISTQVNERPSMIRAARRSAFAKLPERVLVLRTDQLGDMVAGIPAMRRLRSLLPNARIVGLLTTANAEFARTLNLFDEIIIVDFPDDPVQRRRIMPLPEQEALRAKLAEYEFDLALDLAPASESRPLLLLSGAPFLFGMGEYPWLTASYNIQSQEPLNGADFIPHSLKSLSMIEALGALLHGHADPVRREDLDRSVLDPLGLANGDRYIVLHLGARIAFSRWHGYGELAAALLARTDLKIVILSDAPEQSASIPKAVLESERCILIEQRLMFDQLDGLLSFCDLFIGNDSGPKHLASLRGVQVVSIHSARINWGEWAQEMTGLVISRKVPCAGCLLYHHPEECGAGYACVTKIRVDEVLEASLRLLASPL